MFLFFESTEKIADGFEMLREMGGNYGDGNEREVEFTYIFSALVVHAGCAGARNLSFQLEDPQSLNFQLL